MFGQPGAYVFTGPAIMPGMGKPGRFKGDWIVEVQQVHPVAVQPGRCGRIEHRKSRTFYARAARVCQDGAAHSVLTCLLYFVVSAHQHGASDIINLVGVAHKNQGLAPFLFHGCDALGGHEID